MHGRNERNAVPIKPRPSGRSASTETSTWLAVLPLASAVAAIDAQISPGLHRKIDTPWSSPARRTQEHTSSNNSSGDLACRTASVVAASAACIFTCRSSVSRRSNAGFMEDCPRFNAGGRNSGAFAGIGLTAILMLAISSVPVRGCSGRSRKVVIGLAAVLCSETSAQIASSCGYESRGPLGDCCGS